MSAARRAQRERRAAQHPGRRRLTTRLAAALLLAVAAAGAPAQPIALRIAADVAWSGVAAGSGDGSTASMLYPAPTPLLGLVAVLAHGAIVAGSRAADEKRRQQEADRVLEAYQPALAQWSSRDWTDAVLQSQDLLPDARADGEEDAAAAGRWVVDVTPSFALAAERNRLLLDDRLRIAAPGAPAVELVVRVLSPLRAEPFAADDGGAALKAEAARMLAHSVAVALDLRRRAGEGDGDTPTRTHRYLDGEREGFERGQLVGSGCARVVIRTLRGTLLSVPARPSADAVAAGCSESSYRWPTATR